VGGRWRHAAQRAAHKRIRDALYPSIEWGVTLCYRCHHPLEPGDLVELDHADDGSYGGFSHGRSPCRICGQKCNPSAGGLKRAAEAGQQPRSRACVICGLQFTASHSTDGSKAATCGRSDCVTKLKRLRKAHQPDPQPPPQQGRRW
jgi:hypothetical protein